MSVIVNKPMTALGTLAALVAGQQGTPELAEGKVEWILPEGPLPYWRGRITDVAYETAR